MALIFCPECGKQISDRAVMCIGCGISMEEIRKMLCESSVVSAPTEAEDVLIESSVNLGDRIIKCTFCNNEYMLSERSCPKCKNPALCLSYRVETQVLLIRNYKRKDNIKKDKYYFDVNGSLSNPINKLICTLKAAAIKKAG